MKIQIIRFSHLYFYQIFLRKYPKIKNPADKAGFIVLYLNMIIEYRK